MSKVGAVKRNLMEFSNSLDVGTCGPGMALTKYAQLFRVLEVQQTFYQPPQLKTLERWRDNVGEEFEFTIKAWQLITHKATSSTYKRLTQELSSKEKEEAGNFQVTPIIKKALATTIECAQTLGAKSILFQCPKSFKPTPENQENLRRFFELTERPSNIDYFFEPRGDWAPELVKALCVDLHLYHANDPLEIATVTPQKIYFRLHGVSGYRYDYDEFDLQNIFKLASKTSGGFVFFNNTRMTTNAQSFLKIVESSKKSPGTR